MKKVALPILAILLTILSVILISKPANSKQVLRLNEDNTIILYGPVTPASVKEVVKQIRLKDRSLSSGKPLYLILNTPGGSVLDGMDIVNMAQSIDRPIHTVTIFAASMGFVLAQHLNTRYILQNGILMSHRMKTGASGEVGGELDEALRFAKAISDIIDQACANRMGITLEDYKKAVSDEWWLYGQHAVENKAADEVITISCSESLVDSGACPF